MLKFNILTIFPKAFDSYFSESILKRAQKKRLIKINIHNIRDFSKDKHKKVDDRPYGGGPGMVLQVEPICRAVQFVKSKIKNKKSKIKVILFSTRGKKLDNKIAKRLSKCDNLILICGRYEGVDERISDYIADEEISIGDYILSGGELPAMVLTEAVARFVLGVLGKEGSLEEIKGSYPVYTRPDVFKDWRVPKVLLSGDHKKIEEWRKKHR